MKIEVSILLFQKGRTKFNLKEVSLLLFQEGHTVRHVHVKIECKRGSSTPISKGAHEIQSDRGFSTPISKAVLSTFGGRATVSPSFAPCI